MVGANDNLIFDGNSFAMNKDSDLIAVAKGFESELLVFDAFSKTVLDEPSYHKYHEIELALSLGIKEYVHKCGISKVVIGSSGRITSYNVCYTKLLR